MVIWASKLERVAKKEKKIEAKLLKEKQKAAAARISFLTSKIEKIIDEEVVINSDRIIRDGQIQISRRYILKKMEKDAHKGRPNNEEFIIVIDTVKKKYKKAGWIIEEDSGEVITFKRNK
jgi:hypothetical protein